MITIRVFVSSTFRDMHAERDLLNRIVFPELRSRCLRRGADCIVVDLRWGVAEEEAEREGALAICLDEIDRCRPFFVAFLGERFGWVPPGGEVPETLAGWSITALEILRGVFDEGYPPSHALFYLRRPGLEQHPEFPEDLVPVFVEQDASAREKLGALKARIRGLGGRCVVREYDARFGGVRVDPIGGHATVALESTDVDALAAQLLEDLWRAIEPELDRSRPAGDAHQNERAYHERFVRDRTRLFVGRGAERARVVAYVGDAYDLDPLVVTGPPGSGKSAFMADCVRICRALEPEALVIPHFIGASPDSALLPATLRSILETLRRELAIPDEIEADPEKRRTQLRAFLELAAARRRTILVIDALNQLDPAGRGHDLDWLPMALPRGTHVIVSTLPGPILDELSRRVPPGHDVLLRGLPGDDRVALVNAFLGARRKTLTREPLAALLDTGARPDAALPLYLLVALEELCLFGDYERLGARIERLPASLAELFDQVLARLDHDHGADLVEAVCSWLGVSRGGLLEEEVLDLLGRGATFPPLRWARLYRALEPYLKPLEEEGGRRGRIDFYHDQLRLAAWRRYLHTSDPVWQASPRWVARHRELAAYFESSIRDEGEDGWRRDRPRGLSELPYHLMCSEQLEALGTTVTDLRFIEAKAAAGMIYELVGDLQTTRRVIQWSDLVRAFLRFVSADIHLLGRFSTVRGFAAQHAYNAFSDGPIADAARELVSRGRTATRLLRAGSRRAAAADAARVGTLAGHTRAVRAVAMTENGWQAISAGEDRVIRVWDLELCQCVRVLEGHALQVNALAMTPDGRRAVSGANDGTLRVWDVNSGECLQVITCHAMRPVEDHANLSLDQQLAELSKRDVCSVAVTADGMTAVAATGDGKLRWFDLQSGFCVREMQAHRPGGIDVYISPDGTRALSSRLWASDAEEVIAWEATTGRALRTVPGRAAGLLPDGRRAVSVTSRCVLAMWDIDAGTLIHLLEGPEESMTAAAVDAVTGWPYAVTAGRDGMIRIWDLQLGQLEGQIRAHSNALDALAISGASRTAISAGAGDGGILQVWDLKAAPTEAPQRAPAAAGFVLAPDRRQLLSCTEDGTLQLYDLDSARVTRTHATGHRDVRPVAVSPEGRQALLAVGHELHVWDVGSDRSIRIGSFPKNSVTDGLDSAPGECVLWRSDGTVWLMRWNASGHPERVAELIADADGRDTIASFAVAPDGRHAAAGGTYGRVFLLDLTSGIRITLPEGHRADGALRDAGEVRLIEGRVEAVAWSPDGRLFVTGGDDGTIRLWDAQRGGCVRVIGEQSWVQTLAWTVDGRHVLSATRSGALSLWDAASGERVATLGEQLGFPRTIAMLPDGRHVVTSTVDAIRLWDLPVRQLLAVYPANLRGPFSPVDVAGDAVVLGSPYEPITILRPAPPLRPEYNTRPQGRRHA